MEQILCRHRETLAETSFPKDTLPAWRRVGWLPVDEWPTEPAAETGDAPSAPEQPDPESQPTTTSRARARSSKE